MAFGRWGMLVVFLVLAQNALAVELGSEASPLSLEVHGFASQGFILSTHNDYLAESREGSFEFTEVGINFTKPLTENLRMGLQLFSRKLGPLGDYSVKADWFYLDYRWRDWLGIRAGRVKLPFGLYNDTSDVDSARVPILLPQSVYPTQNRDFLLAQTGAEVYGYFGLQRAGALNYRLYGGTIFLETPTQPSSPIAVLSLTVPYLFGGRVTWETPIDGLRLASSVQALRLDTNLLFAGAKPAMASVRIPAVLWVGSAEYFYRDLLLSAEYSRWFVGTDSSNPAVFPSGPTVISERAYGMASYRVRSWFQPGAYYSVLFPNTDRRQGRENMQHDVAGTLRFDINENWLVKLEGHYMVGTAGLSSSLNDNQPLATLARDWCVFLVKTTATF